MFQWMVILSAQIQSLEDNLLVTRYFSSPEISVGHFSSCFRRLSLKAKQNHTDSRKINPVKCLVILRVNMFTAVVQILFVEIVHNMLIELLGHAPNSYWFKKMDSELGDFGLIKEH